MSNVNILSVFYSVFNFEKGAEIVFQIPENFIKPEDFKKISDFIIPKTELCEKIISLKLGNSYLLGFPVYLTNKNYERIRFQFNVGMIIPGAAYANNFHSYDLLVKKIAKTFENIEVDNNFDFLLKNKEIVVGFLKKFYASLMGGETFIRINMKDIIESRKDSAENKESLILKASEKADINFIFKFINPSLKISALNDHDVPLWINEFPGCKLKYSEQRIKDIINQIDGVKTIKSISKITNYPIKYVKYIIYNLQYVKCIAVVDVFKYSNIYRSNNNLKNFIKDNLYEKFVNISLLNERPENKSNKYYKKDSHSDKVIFSYYVALAKSKNVANFSANYNIDELNIKLFTAVGVHLNIIRRVHCYLYLESFPKKYKDESFIAMLDGKHCEDEICCKFNISLNNLMTIYEEIKQIASFKLYIIYK